MYTFPNFSPHFTTSHARFVMGCGASAKPSKPPDPPSETEKAERKADRSEDKKAAQLENKDRL